MERPAAFAGAWYPGGERDCRAAVEAHAAGTEPEPGPWRGLVGPHAGWVYSGDAAGHAWRWLAEANPDADLVVIFGAHRGLRGPNTVFRGTGWRTPLGTLVTAGALADAAAGRARLDDEPADPARPDNAVEPHLPFAKRFFPRAELLVVGVAANAPDAVRIGSAIGELVVEHQRHAVFAGSTDLTHYGPTYDFAPAGHGPEATRWVREVSDRGFLDAVLEADPVGVVDHALAHGSACCPGAVAATLSALRAAGTPARPRLVDHYLSCDVRPSSSFVGYAGLVL